MTKQGMRSDHHHLYQHETNNDEINDVLLMEMSDITIKANLIVVENDQTTTSTSIPTISSSITTNYIYRRILKLSFKNLFLYFYR